MCSILFQLDIEKPPTASRRPASSHKLHERSLSYYNTSIATKTNLYPLCISIIQGWMVDPAGQDEANLGPSFTKETGVGLDGIFIS